MAQWTILMLLFGAATYFTIYIKEPEVEAGLAAVKTRKKKND